MIANKQQVEFLRELERGLGDMTDEEFKAACAQVSDGNVNQL
jgi:hypothetical protein